MGIKNNLLESFVSGPFSVFGASDPSGAMIRTRPDPAFCPIRKGIVEQFNVGLYSVLVSSGSNKYVCMIGERAITPVFGYSESTPLREGDAVIFCVLNKHTNTGVILGREPIRISKDDDHQNKVQHKTEGYRRTHFFSKDCYAREAEAYKAPLTGGKDFSARVYTSNRPTDLVPGEFGMLNQHRCGFLGGLYSMTMVGGGAHIRVFALENKIREVADSIFRCTMVSNDNEWHNRRYLSRERQTFLYQEERLGVKSKETPAFEKADYHTDGYFTKKKEEKQTSIPRLLVQEGYFAGISTRYCMQPDPDAPNIMQTDTKPKMPGAFRESIDPSGQYRMAAAGMISMERIGRIPVPIRFCNPWQKEAEEPKAEKLKAFEHDTSHPYYRQLELADRVAYDVKNSYARLDESPTEFFVPQEDDLKNKLKDSYDKEFTKSETVKIEKYDKRRSGIWQGEDGSIIFRDAWGSEIVMIGGNIQISCAGNVEILPGKSALTLAGDDIVTKAQNSIDIESADKDVRVNAFKNVQVMAGANDDNPGGIILEAHGEANPWDAKDPEGGEEVKTSGIVLKSKKGKIITDAQDTVLRSRKSTRVLSGESELDGELYVSAKTIYARGESVTTTTGEAALVMDSGMASLVGDSVVVSGKTSAIRISGGKYPVPLTEVDTTDVASTVLEALNPMVELLKDEEQVGKQYTLEKLDKMYFKFRSSKECGTDKGWELNGPDKFTLYQPFWVQVQPKFETLKSATTKKFEDHTDTWEDPGKPWPGKDAVNDGKYAQLGSDTPTNMTSDGMNKSRKSVVNKSSVTEKKLFDGYKIRT